MVQQGDQVRVLPSSGARIQAGVVPGIHLSATALRMMSPGELYRAQLPPGNWWWGTDLTAFGRQLTWQDCFAFRADWVSGVTFHASPGEGDALGRVLPDQADRLPCTWAA